jgi:hypothetical protein
LYLHPYISTGEDMNKDEALEKKAENARELGLNYEPEVFSKQNYLNGYCVGQSDLLAEQEKQEPVAWITEWEGQYSSGKILDYIAHTRGGKVEYTPLYTTPPQRTWVGLTNDELTDLFYNENLGQECAVSQAIALLKERNT